MVTGRTILRSMDAPSLLQMDTDELLRPLLALISRLQLVRLRPGLSGEIRIKSVGLEIFRFPVEVGDLVERAERVFRVAVTVEAERHAQGLCVVDHRHFVNTTVAFDTTDPPIDVRRMVEVGILGNLVDLHPLDRLSGIIFVIFVHCLTERLELWRIGLHLPRTMTVPADLSGGNI